MSIDSKSLLTPGQGGLAKLCLRSDDGASAEVYCHGAHVTSWIPAANGAHNEEQLFLSSRADFAAGSAIRGGVPVIFPQFADCGPLLKHGFARSAEWQYVSQTTGKQASALFRLQDSATTRSHWPYAFMAEYEVRIGGNSLQLMLRVTNTDTRPFSFTAALHTYLRVGDIDNVLVEGLEGLRYRDSAAGGVEHKEAAQAVSIDGEVDRIYFSATRPIKVVEATPRVQVRAAGFNDAVIWNPGAVKAAALSDLEPQGFQHMLCVEAAAIDKARIVAVKCPAYRRSLA